MREVRVALVFDGTVSEAEACWFDTIRWPRWVDGLQEVLAVNGDWPGPGSSVSWESGPAGRGRVTESVIAREALSGQTLEVQDASMRGRQEVTFTPADSGVEVALALRYELRRRSPVSGLVDLLFIRRAMTASLENTVRRFGAELEASREGRRT